MNPQDDHPQPAEASSRDTRSRWPWRFILLIVALATGIVIVGQARRGGGHDQVAWRNSYNQATVEANKTAKPLLVVFSADWCPPCKQMKAWVYSDPTVADSIEAGFVPIRVDLTREGLPDQHLADRYHVKAIPTFLTLTAAGEPISRSSGYMNKAELLDWLATATQQYVKLQAEDTSQSATAFVEEGQTH